MSWRGSWARSAATLVCTAGLALFAKGGCGTACAEVTGTIAIVHTPFYYALGASMAMCSMLLAYQLIRRPDADEGRDPGD